MLKLLYQCKDWRNFNGKYKVIIQRREDKAIATGGKNLVDNLKVSRNTFLQSKFYCFYGSNKIKISVGK